MRTEHGKRSQVVIRVLPSAELILEVGSTLWLKHDVFKVRYIAASLRGALLWPSPCFSYDALTIVSLFHVLFVSRFQCKMWNNFTSALHTPGGLFFFSFPVCFLFVFSFFVPDILVHLLPPINGCAGKIQPLRGGREENGWLFFHSIEQSWLLLPFLTLQYYWN